MGCCSYSPLREPKASSHFPGLQRNWSWKPLHLMHSLSQCPENKSCFLSEWHNCIWKRWSSQLVALVTRSANRIAKVTLTIGSTGSLGFFLLIFGSTTTFRTSALPDPTKTRKIRAFLQHCTSVFSHMYFTFAVFTGNWLSSNEVWVRLWSSWREVGPSTPRITYPDWMLRNVIVEDDGMLRESRDWVMVTRSEWSSRIRNLYGKENTSNYFIVEWLTIFRILQNKEIDSLTCYLKFLSQCYSALFLRVCLVTMYVQYPPQEGQRHWHIGTEEVTQPLHLWCTADRQNRL